MLVPNDNFDIPEMTIKVARAAFPKGNPYLTLRDELGTIFEDADFTELYPDIGQPTITPWRLALVTLVQFREKLSDRQVAEAVRGRIDLKYLLGLALEDPGFNFSVLSEFRARLLDKHESLLLEKLLSCCLAKGLLKARGQQRTDATHVLAAIRAMNRLELVGETMRAALNALAKAAPTWLRQMAPLEWYDRYKRRIEDYRLPTSKEKRAEYAQSVGEDGFKLLDLLAASDLSNETQSLSEIEALRLVWERHYESSQGKVRFKSKRELAPASAELESPYDPDARYRRRRETKWVGYIVHLTETCDQDAVNLITHVETTKATVHEAKRTETIHQALVDKGLPPKEHLVDSAYVGAKLLVNSMKEHQIDLVGPGRVNTRWQAKIEGGYDLEQFTINWEEQTVQCPQEKTSSSWKQGVDRRGHAFILAQFSAFDCRPCPARSLCTRSDRQRGVGFRPREQYEALQKARQRFQSEAGKALYNRRAGLEGTISQGVRGFGLRQARYRGLAKTHLQHVATAAAINIDRIVAWLDNIPRAKTRTSRFAALAPAT